jgi:hypothetical protein
MERDIKTSQPTQLLSIVELRELTGRSRPGAICRALREMGIHFLAGARPGEPPKVLRAHVVALLTGALPRVEDRPPVLPNFGVFSRPASNTKWKKSTDESALST